MNRHITFEFQVAKRLMIAIAILLSLAVPLINARPAAAGDSGGDVSAEALVSMLADACAASGGLLTVHYNLDTGGHIEDVLVWCIGSRPDTSWFCDIYPNGTYACGFVMQEETPVESTRPGPGGIVDAAAGPNPISTPTVVLNQEGDSPRVPVRPTTQDADKTDEEEDQPTRERGN